MKLRNMILKNYLKMLNLIKRRDKASTSNYWRYFVKIGESKGGKERARYNCCNKIYVTDKRKYGTSHLNHHVMKCDKRKTKDVGQMILDMQGKLKEKKIYQVIHRELLSNIIIRHNLPYKFVEYPELRTWINYLCPYAIMVSRNIVKTDIGRMYMKEKIMVKELFASIPSRICLTSCLLYTSDAADE